MLEQTENTPGKIEGLKFFSSFSGGKDSCLAFHRALKEGGRPGFLVTMLTENGRRSRAHGLPLRLVERQAEALGVPLVTRAASWEGYEESFVRVLEDLNAGGVEAGVFGDIDLEEHREWCRRVCSRAGLRAFHPLWGRERGSLIEEFLGLGFSAFIIAVKKGVLDMSFLGRRLDRGVMGEMDAAGVDVSGEGGEYHTVVTDGPIFSEPVELVQKDVVEREGYLFLDVAPGG